MAHHMASGLIRLSCINKLLYTTDTARRACNNHWRPDLLSSPYGGCSDCDAKMQHRKRTAHSTLCYKVTRCASSHRLHRHRTARTRSKESKALCVCTTVHRHAPIAAQHGPCRGKIWDVTCEISPQVDGCHLRSAKLQCAAALLRAQCAGHYVLSVVGMLQAVDACQFDSCQARMRSWADASAKRAAPRASTASATHHAAPLAPMTAASATACM